MSLSSLCKLQLVRSLLLLLILLDVVGSTVLFLRLGSGEELKETLVDQVSQNIRCKCSQPLHPDCVV